MNRSFAIFNPGKLLKKQPERIKLAVFLLALRSGTVFAALDVDDLMSIAWEGMWHQGGSPVALYKWNQPLKVRINGAAEGSQNRKWIDNGLKEITEASNLSYTTLPSDDTNENVLIDIVRESPKLSETTPCSTHYNWSNAGIKRVEITARDKYVYNCILHEFGHMVGIAGHPYGRTVMTYFNRFNELSDYDRFILKARYSAELKHGASPFKVLRVIGERYLAEPRTDDDREQARKRIDTFMASVLRDAEKYALAAGEPPLVVYRSGRISLAAANDSRKVMQYFLGETLFDGDLGIVDPVKALESLEKGAANKNQAAAWSLARRYQDGRGLNKDPIQAYAWYSFAAKLGSQAAQKRAQKIEEGVSASELVAYMEAAEKLHVRFGESITLNQAKATE